MIYASLFPVCIVDHMFWEVMQLRKEMSLAKLGYFKEELWSSAWDHARTSLNTWKMAEYFYGYLIFISKVWAQDFFPLLQFTPRSTVISFKLTYADFAYSLVEHYKKLQVY